MHPIIKQIWTPEDLPCWGIRGIGDVSNEELARLQEKVAGWIRQGGCPRKS